MKTDILCIFYAVNLAGGRDNKIYTSPGEKDCLTVGKFCLGYLSIEHLYKLISRDKI